MKYRELIVLLPCHSLEDFPVHHTGDDADSLLAGWTALWHPALVAAAESPPKWHRVDYPPDDLSNTLILVPRPAVTQLAAGFMQRVRDAGGVAFTVDRDRPAMLSQIFAQFDGGDGGVSGELAADFLATGYAYLQVQILTRQMRYASNLDEVRFFNQFGLAAKAATEGNETQARELLSTCFNQLAEERDHYYSGDAYLIDLTLVADESAPSALLQELSEPTIKNLLMTAEVAEALKARQPAVHQKIIEGLSDGRVGFVGGERIEQRLPLLPCEDILTALRTGLANYEDALGRRVEVFGRRKFGLTPALPGILEKLRFRGALHATLDDGKFPSGSQTKTRWQGFDTGVIDAIVRAPLDVGLPETFLNFAKTFGELMDHDRVATLCLAHWPNHASLWYEDLKRCAKFTAALGKFITVERYFDDTYSPGHLDRFTADQYRSPYLRHDVIRKQPDPISTTVRRWQSRFACDLADATATLASIVANRATSAAEVRNLGGGDPGAATEMDRVNDAVADFATSLKRQSSPEILGYLVVNPCSFVRRLGVDVSELPNLPDEGKPIYAASVDNGRKYAIADVPPMGFAWIESGKSDSRRNKSEPPLAADTRERDGVVWLRNEFLESSIDPITGTMQTLKDYSSRGNRLSQQLALRMPAERGRPGDTWRDPDELASYSIMAADEVRVVASSAAYGEVESRGRLLDTGGQVLATFRQTYSLWRGSRVVQLDVELDPRTETTSDPWNSYYACRFAWSDESASLFHSVNQTRQPATKGRFESPLYVEIEAGEQRTAILTGGLPYHRRVGSRMLDSLLIVRGERSRSCRLGIGLDVPQILPEAIGLLMPTLVKHEHAAAPTPVSCWLFHVDARSVVATHWSTLIQDGKLVGVRARFLEGAGRGVRAKLSGFRSFTTARQVNFRGETLSELPIAEGKVVLDMSGHEWIEIEARWS